MRSCGHKRGSRQEVVLKDVCSPVSHPVGQSSESPVLTNDVTETQPHPLLYTLCLLSHCDSRPETMEWQSLKRFLPGLLEKKFADPGVEERVLELKPRHQET